MEVLNRRYMESRHRPILIFVILLAAVVVLFNFDYYSGDYAQQRQRHTRWADCFNQATGSLDDNQFWDQLGTAADKCQPLLEMNSARLQGFQNNDETKYHLLPIDRSQDSVIISLGIGGDVEAEKKLKPHLSDNSVFLGTDPDITNHKVYRQVGTYLPVSVGHDSGNITVDHLAVNGQYVSGQTFMITLPDLVREYIPKSTKVVDDIWVDIEYSEYKIFDYFTTAGDLHKQGYAICQWNAEVHNPSAEQKKIFHDFMKQTISEGRYAFLKLTAYWGHWRMIFLDYNDRRCANKYLLGN